MENIDDSNTTSRVRLTPGLVNQSTENCLPIEDHSLSHTVERTPNDCYARSEFEPGDLIAGRFEIVKAIGRGGFGSVYSALDRVLNRVVAVKRSLALRSFVAGRVRFEAKAIASLNHPNIVAIHDLISVSNNELVIVMEHLDGEPLSRLMRRERLPVGKVIQVIEQIVSALHHAHQRQLVHSDVKPSNVYYLNTGQVKLLDFGLAVAYFPDGQNQGVGGTPGYMAPEQVRGESHLIDGRSDIWAVGVLAYEMLTGHRPFTGSDATAIRDATLRRTAPPLRQLAPEVDEELQRIVLKCLEKRMCDRYDACKSLLDDIQAWRADNPYMAQQARVDVRPKNPLDAKSVNSISPLPLHNRGLQPFTALDAEAFLPLIPGTRDRSGVPNSIRFWQRWINSDDSSTEYPVGVLYGPSGTGKSSYVRAGLIPQLGSQCLAIYIECRPGDLAGRLTRLIEAQVLEHPSGSSLRDALTRVRLGDSNSRRFRKVMLVLDQFEVWASTASLEARREFAEALRQCDGTQLRALLVTRDDYWMGVREILQWLELPLQEGRNVAAIDLIDPELAERILEATGRENGLLPMSPNQLSDDQRLFLKQAINELTHDNAIIAVHLVMFAHMTRLGNWTPEYLRQSGGVVGACSFYFEDLFTDRSHPEFYRVGPAVATIVRKLLPGEGSSVLEASATRQELELALTEAECRSFMEDALRILTEEIKMVTSFAAETNQAEVLPSSENAAIRFRLSHDFIVAPLAQWLDRSQGHTWQGRTKSRLSQLAKIWSRRHGSIGQFPTFGEYLTLTVRSQFIPRSDDETQYLRAATRFHAGKITATLLTLIAFLAMSVVAFSQWTEASRERQKALLSEVDLLFDGPAAEVPIHIERLKQAGARAVNLVSGWTASVNKQRLYRARLFTQSKMGQSIAPLVDAIEYADPELMQLTRQITSRAPDGLVELRTRAAIPDSPVVSIRAAVLAAYLGDSQPLSKLLEGSDDANRDTTMLKEVIRWRMEPKPFAMLLMDPTQPGPARYHAGVILGSYPKSELVATNPAIDPLLLIQSPQIAVHSIGRFLAAHLGIEIPEGPLRAPENADWRVGPDNIPMTKIPAQDVTYETIEYAQPFTNKLSLAKEYWISTVPVSTRFYNEFANSNAILADGKKLSPVTTTYFPEPLKNRTDNQPVLRITLNQAYEFCNWLSRREGLEPCYEYRIQTPAEPQGLDFKPGPIPWVTSDSANGYRLPTPDQFIAATHANYRRGIPWSHVEAIGQAGSDFIPASGQEYARNLYSLIPNRLGCFLNDPNCGSWVCMDPHTTEARRGTVGYNLGSSRERALIDLSVFLVRH